MYFASVKEINADKVKTLIADPHFMSRNTDISVKCYLDKYYPYPHRVIFKIHSSLNLFIKSWRCPRVLFVSGLLLRFSHGRRGD